MALSSGMALSSHSRSMGSCWTPWVYGPFQRSVRFLWAHLPQTQLGKISAYPVENVRLCSLGYLLRGSKKDNTETRLDCGQAALSCCHGASATCRAVCPVSYTHLRAHETR